MSDSDIKCIRQCDLVVLVLDYRDNFNDVLVKHKTDVFIVGT